MGKYCRRYMSIGERMEGMFLKCKCKELNHIISESVMTGSVLHLLELGKIEPGA